MNKLIDPHGRSIHKLRLSLLDACNFRCLYCMPEKVEFMPSDKFMDKFEIFNVTKTLVDYGIDEIRLTGGEPALRTDFLEIVKLLSKLPLKKLGLTSNGVRLKKFLPDLKKSNLLNINFSLDSLNRKTFKTISRSDSLEQVLESIFLAKELGFNVKINTVVMKGLNDHEIEDFIEFSGKYGIEVRFLEVMKIGVMVPMFERYFISADQLMAQIKTKWIPKTIPVPVDSTSYNYTISNGAKIGFIASESKPFCHGCSRLRMGPDGSIFPCLMIDKGFSLRGKNREEIGEALIKTMGLKPTYRIDEMVKPMYQIGG
ncbi:MAG: GTP 3',8-cyclase MoaA [Epsilonproteobacteria bacterium]|nr:MAG: GTP 3',8-cyclase MoaA [Campylobacterota bacterium]RLA67678.1 MAG: GTP 3',8-cyclase MoaA [Campylobacterota bacterium]